MLDRPCHATTKTGQPCRGRALPGEDRCWIHSDTYAAQRPAWKRKGGRHKSNQHRATAQVSDEPFTLTALVGLLSRNMRRVEAGTLEPGVLNALSGAARAVSEITKTSDLEARIEALEGTQHAREGLRRIA